MFASRSATASESSANAGSNALSGNSASPSPAPRAESRNEEREEGRSGVVGRGVRDREPERLMFASASWNVILLIVVFSSDVL